MTPNAYQVHQSGDRYRFQIPSKRNEIPFFEEVKKTLLEFETVYQVETRSFTGSVVIFIRGPIDPVAEFAEKKGLFYLSTLGQSPEPAFYEQIQNSLNDLNRKFLGYTSGEISLYQAIALSLFGLSAFQASKKQILPAASALLFEAFRMIELGKIERPESRLES